MLYDPSSSPEQPALPTNAPSDLPRPEAAAASAVSTGTAASGAASAGPWREPTPPAPLDEDSPLPARPRRIVLPVALFLATCGATFWAGAHARLGEGYVPDLGIWRDGLTYMAAVMGILLAHEMGHFLQAVRYRVPASLPFFIPMPLTPFGTMGAVIGMQGSKADRRQMFDIGISGPLAGLLLAVPVAWLGIQRLELHPGMEGSISFGLPLALRGLLWLAQPELSGATHVALEDMNPLLLAGWVGLLLTGLNMLPVSQLDGGHVTYALFGKKAHYLARGLLLTAMAVVVSFNLNEWIVMLVLVTMLGVDHPPTANDRVPLGRLRTCLGLASLGIPILCLMPSPFRL